MWADFIGLAGINKSLEHVHSIEREGVLLKLDARVQSKRPTEDYQCALDGEAIRQERLMKALHSI